MSVEATSKTLRSYLEALVARGDFADYFTDDASWTTIGGGQELHGRGPVRTSSSGAPKPSTPDPRSRPWSLAMGKQPWRPTASAPTPASSWNAGQREIGPGALLGGLRPAARQNRCPSRLHPHGPVRPTAPVSSTWGWSAHP